jgi:hypothetical protein
MDKEFIDNTYVHKIIIKKLRSIYINIRIKLGSISTQVLGGLFRCTKSTQDQSIQV